MISDFTAPCCECEGIFSPTAKEVERTGEEEENKREEEENKGEEGEQPPLLVADITFFIVSDINFLLKMALM